MTTYEQLVEQRQPVCVVGLGYVGLPLAVALSKKFPVVGFDVNQRRIDELKQGKDITGEQQQNYMRKRVLFQGIAIVVVILILVVAGQAGK